MSVLIKGMEMPQSCEGCKLRYRHQGFTVCDHCFIDMRNIDPWTFGRDRNGGKPDWCPLVEVKTPHGELIERKSAKVRFYQNCHWTYSIENACEICAGCPIDAIPTIIEAEGGGEDE